MAFYSRFVERVVPVSGTREAEMAKLLENTYRHVNIALVNEMAIFCDELDVNLWEAIEAASTKPFGFQKFLPGPGVGGHCIPVDPSYLSYTVRKLGYPFRFVELAQEINERMPAYVVARVQRLLNRERKAVNGSRVLLLGVTYKPDIADQRETPAVPVAEALLELGAELSYCDPHVPEWEIEAGRSRVRRTWPRPSRRPTSPCCSSSTPYSIWTWWRIGPGSCSTLAACSRPANASSGCRRVRSCTCSS